MSRWADYYALTKPRVVMLIVFTAFVGMLLTNQYGLPPIHLMGFGLLGITLAAASAAAFNHVLDRRFDQRMRRTANRPLAAGRLPALHALLFATVLGIASMLILVVLVNTLTALLTLMTLIGYALLYTLYLKHATPQNIVIGGLAGAAPPVLGWSAVTGTVGGEALLLCLIVFVWTPPHFWALALHRHEEYREAGVPMLPITHGDAFTRLHIWLYAILLAVVTCLPFVTGMSGWWYFVPVLVLNAVFLYYAFRVWRARDDKATTKLFGYSIIYLTLLFVCLLVDHYMGG